MAHLPRTNTHQNSDHGCRASLEKSNSTRNIIAGDTAEGSIVQTPKISNRTNRATHVKRKYDDSCPGEAGRHHAAGEYLSLSIPPYSAFDDWNVFLGSFEESSKSLEGPNESKKSKAIPCAAGFPSTLSTGTTNSHGRAKNHISQKLLKTAFLGKKDGVTSGATDRDILDDRGVAQQDVKKAAILPSQALSRLSPNSAPHDLPRKIVRAEDVSIAKVSKDMDYANNGSEGLFTTDILSRSQKQKDCSPNFETAMLVPESDLNGGEEDNHMEETTFFSEETNFRRVIIGIALVVSYFTLIALLVILGVSQPRRGDGSTNDGGLMATLPPSGFPRKVSTEFPSSSPPAAPTGNAWLQKGSDIVGPSSDLGAVSISADGSRLAVGFPEYTEKGLGRRGLVLIYEVQDENWNRSAMILGDTADLGLGYSVSLSRDGTRVAAGAPKYDRNRGQVKMFEYRNESWVPLGRPLLGEARGDGYGYSVSMSRVGSIVAVGGRWNGGENGKNRGHARVHEFQDGNWTQLGDDIDGEANGDRSGHSLALSWDGRIVAIGARGNNENGIKSGHVRVYSYENLRWKKIGQDLDGEAAQDKSGHSVSLSSDGSILAIGSFLNGENGSESGHVRIYKYKKLNNEWVQLGEDIDGETANANSGHSVSLSADGNVVAIGATKNGIDGSKGGHTRVFEYDGNSWTQSGSTIYGRSPDRQSGWSVSLSEDGGRVAVGDKEGLVRVFDTPFSRVGN